MMNIRNIKRKRMLHMPKEFCYHKNEKKKEILYNKARDHCHYTAKFRRAAHSICNLN